MNSWDWVPCYERMPEEYDSIFAEYYGTVAWDRHMWRRESSFVLATVEFSDGSRIVETKRTHDGKWYHNVSLLPRTVIAWMPFPKPYEPPKEDA